MKFFDKTWKLALSGAVAGLLVALLAIYGNPANMAICVACFIRDSAGALKLHTAAPVQYFRPEIVGFVCGSFLLALLTKEYKSTAGSSPMVRFILGAAMMIGALVFLGCPLRMVLRMSAGDLNAWVALIGFAGGVATGSFFLKKGFSLGRAARHRHGDRRLRHEHRGPRQQARARYPFSGRGAHHRRACAEEPHVLRRKHPRRHPHEKL